MRVPMKKKSATHWSLDHKGVAPPIASANLTGKKEFFGEVPSIFVGRYGYPKVNVGLLSTDSYNEHDAPKTWVKEGYSIPRIIDLRSQLINSRFSADVKQLKGQFVSMAQELAMSDQPTDTEIHLNKAPTFRISFQKEATPFGPSVDLTYANLTENTHVPTRVERAVGDTDAKAKDAVNELYGTGQIDEHYLTRLLSAGTLGKVRRMVPTRWSITAVDDTIGKGMLDTIRTYDTTGNLAFQGGYLGNHFIILLLDDLFSYELFETHNKHTGFTTDFEPYTGRTKYAEQTAGGYYAARLPILEMLSQRKQQASVLAIRIITDEYSAPLGVWVVREAVRNALSNEPIAFCDKHLMLTYAAKWAQRKWGYDISPMLTQSCVLKNAGVQRRLSMY